MRSPTRTLAAVLLATFVWLCWPAASLSAEARAEGIAFKACGETEDFACGHLTVPLDPSGATAGTVTLALRRHRAPLGEAHSAIIALAGGPGQPALPFAEQFVEELGSVASTRDLIVFDQRGIGASQPLSCHALEHPGQFHSSGALVEACASQLGPDRAFYTTADTVADIEAIRRAGGYEKLILDGTSYGTKVAEEYAQQYPSHVEGLVLDSVVPPNGPEPLERATFAAIPRILKQICAAHSCAHVTGNPVADLTRLLKGMTRRPLSGQVIDGNGHGRRVKVVPGDLYGLLLAGDFSSVLRAEFVTYVSAAAKGDTAPLARLVAAGEEGEGEGEDFDMPLYYATTCEDEDFPWNRAADAGGREAQARAAARALPSSVFAPFSASDAISFSDVEACAHWPYSSTTQPSDTLPFPNVPTLILSGADDLRTPTANAREVAAQIPDAHLLVVPYAGHSVLSDEPTACAREALLSLFSSGVVKACRAAPAPRALRPPPLPPLRIAQVTPAGGNRGLPGRTVHAVALTIEDAARALVGKILAAIDDEDISALSNLRAGGLRAGWVVVSGSSLTLHGYSFVPGMTLSGKLTAGSGTLRVSGASAADGTVHVGAHDTLTGTLAGTAVHLVQRPGATAAIVGTDAEASPRSAVVRAAGIAAARRLAKLLGGFGPQL